MWQFTVALSLPFAVVFIAIFSLFWDFVAGFDFLLFQICLTNSRRPSQRLPGALLPPPSSSSPRASRSRDTGKSGRRRSPTPHPAKRAVQASTPATAAPPRPDVAPPSPRRTSPQPVQPPRSSNSVTSFVAVPPQADFASAPAPATSSASFSSAVSGQAQPRPPSFPTPSPFGWNPFLWSSSYGAPHGLHSPWTFSAPPAGPAQLSQLPPPPGYGPLYTAPPPGFGFQPMAPPPPTHPPLHYRTASSGEATTTPAVPIPRASVVTQASRSATASHRAPIPRSQAVQEVDRHSPGARSQDWLAPDSDFEPQDVAYSHASGDDVTDQVMAGQYGYEGGSPFSDADWDLDQPPVLHREPATPSPSGLLDALSTYTDAVTVVEEQRTDLSYAEQALGRFSSGLGQTQIHESPLIQRALQHARQRFLAPSSAECPLPGADAPSERATLSRPLGHLAPPPGRNPLRGLNWQFPSFRPRRRPLGTSDEEKDRLGLSRRPPTCVPVSDKALRNFEFSAAQGLATVGTLDTMLAALANALSERDDSRSCDPHQESDAVPALLSALVDNTQACADYMATLYFNTTLLRRDLLLSASILPATARATARAVPVTPPYLLGSAAGQVVQDAAARASSALALKASMASAARVRRPATQGAPPRKAPRLSAPPRSSSSSSAPARQRSATFSRNPPRRQDQRRAPVKGKHPQ